MTTKREDVIHSHNDETAHHVMSVGTYLAVFIALLVLLGATVAVSFFDLGIFSRIVAVTIAAVKAGLIVTYFMHLRHSQTLVWVFAGIGFLWFVIMFSITISDYIARGSITGPLGGS